jgi:hypothetical protein
MSVSGAGGNRVDRIAPPETTDAAAEAAGASGATSAARPARGSAPTGRHAVAASIGSRSGAPAAAATPVAIALDNGAAVLTDGSIVSTTPNAPGGPLGAMTQLALQPSGSAAPFDKVTDPVLLAKIADKLAETHAGLTGRAADDATTLAWRQSRAAALNLLEQAALRAKALGNADLARTLTDKLVATIKSEPWRQVRDFAYDSLVDRVESKALPATRAAAAAREELYPSKPPYDKWLADGKIDIYLTLDNNGSSIDDNVQFYKSLGFRDKKNADGSHLLTLKGTGGKPGVEITIPALPKDGSEPALFDQMDNPKYDVIAYGGHAGHGQRIEHALAQGVKGTGKDKAVVLMQCWGHGNVESLERTFPDAQVVSTTEMTSDNYDWDLMQDMIEGFQKKAGWNEIQKKTVSDLKRDYPEDIQNHELDPDAHYFFPTTRSLLVQKYDRDGDGVPDQGDHIFNVIYPKRIDAAGGYDPVVQPVPTYALDGTNLNQAVNQLSLVVRYDHLLPPEQERKLPWDPTKWKPGGFFEPAAGDLSAFRFTRNAQGEVEVALSTRFAHTGKQELARMLGYESGLWLAKEAGLTGADRTAMAVGMTQRVIEAQGSWVGGDGNLLTEPWAEEELFDKRYGLSGFTFAGLTHELGEPEDYRPEDFQKVARKIRSLPGAAALADRAPTSVGTAIPVNAEIRFLSESGWTSIGQEKVQSALRSLGVAGEVKSFSPEWLNQNQATNVTALVSRDGKTEVVSLGVDSEGVVKTAARLPLDMTKKLDATAERMLADTASGLPDGSINPGKADPAALYDRERAAGKTPAQAMAAVFDAMVGKVRSGAYAPSLWELQNLNRMGLLSNDDLATVQAAVHRAYPG